MSIEQAEFYLTVAETVHGEDSTEAIAAFDAFLEASRASIDGFVNLSTQNG